MRTILIALSLVVAGCSSAPVGPTDSTDSGFDAGIDAADTADVADVADEGDAADAAPDTSDASDVAPDTNDAADMGEPDTCACSDASAPCCDGCHYLGTETRCAEGLERVECEVGTGQGDEPTCGDYKLKITYDQYCSGDASSCSGERRTTDSFRWQQCRGDSVCNERNQECLQWGGEC